MVNQVCHSQGAQVIVAGVATDRERLDLASETGAFRSVDQTQEDLAEIVYGIKSEGADITFECSGIAAALNTALELTRRGKAIQMGVFSNAKESILTDLILHKELEYIGSRSQKPSSWRTALNLLERGTVVPERIVSSIVDLRDWRVGFEAMIKGGHMKTVIHPNPDLK
jgi:L-iditol 2-dehydrogenase